MSISHKSIAYYDDLSYDYKKYWRQREYEDKSERIALLKFFKLISKKGVLADIGAGFGRLTPIYAPLFKKCVLIDPSKRLLDEAKKLTEKYKNLNLRCCFAQNLPFTNNSFDVILFIRAFHHLKDPNKVIAEFNRILKPGGFLILEFANKVHIKSVIKSILDKRLGYILSHVPQDISHKEGIPFFNYHPTHVKSLLLSSGFNVIKTLSVSNFRNPIFKKLISLPILLFLESFFQLPASYFHFGPSIFILAQKSTK